MIKNPKVWGPSQRFWFFGFVVPSAETKKPKIQSLSGGGPKLLEFVVFLGFFWFSNRHPKKNMFFVIFKWKTKKPLGVFGCFCSASGDKPKNLCFLDFCCKTKKHCVFFGFLLENQKT